MPPGASPEWVEASGHGTIFSFTTIRRGTSAFETPYTCALVMLDEGVLVLSRLETEPGTDIRGECRSRSFSAPSRERRICRCSVSRGNVHERCLRRHRGRPAAEIGPRDHYRGAYRSVRRADR
ncbi:Zn-ribbon domain-containing OB-fold protein [Ancylobacter crimeensis]|uniref:Zn-ribbon domain-containing OB-fold protein n=1 Tax=Ancylobacter crimeensis TaxID=2579147 RepID=UPI003CCFE9A1